MRIDPDDCRMRLAPLLDEAGLRLVSLVVVERSKTVRLTVLRGGGTNHRDCARAASLLRRLYENAEGDLSDHYAIEVSSPGIGYRIKLPGELPLFIGERLRLILVEGGERTGVIESIGEDGIGFRDDAGCDSFAWDTIRSACTL